MKQPPYEAPNFTLPDNEGINHSLHDYKGKWLVLYFYPKDGSPGCTTEACSFRDTRDEIEKLGAKVVGISRDDAKSHNKFISKYNLNYTLLSDPNYGVIDAYGAWNHNGIGWAKIIRKTFIISPEGMVVKAYDHVTPDGHGEQIVNDLKILKTV